MTKLAIFDMDGVILDSMGYWRNLIVDGLTDYLGEPVDFATVRKLMSMNNDAAISYINSKYSALLSKPFTAKDIAQTIIKRYKNDVKPKSFVVDIVRNYCRSGVKTILMSATPTDICKIALDKHGLIELFAEIFGNSDKSNPREFIKVITKYNVKPSETVLFEDSLYSIKTAASIGIKTIAVADKYCIDSKGIMMSVADEFIEQ